MTIRDLKNAALIALASVAAYVGLMFGSDIARYRAMSAALAQVETCETDGECEHAWEQLQALRGRN